MEEKTICLEKKGCVFFFLSKQSNLTLFFHLHSLLSKPILGSSDPEDNTKLELPRIVACLPY